MPVLEKKMDPVSRKGICPSSNFICENVLLLKKKKRTGKYFNPKQSWSLDFPTFGVTKMK